VKVVSARPPRRARRRRRHRAEQRGLLGVGEVLGRQGVVPAQLARQGLATGRSLPELAVTSGMVGQDELDALLHPAALIRRVEPTAAAGEGEGALDG
jgi:hypothetical protein